MPFMKSLPDDASQLHLFRNNPQGTRHLLAFTEVLLRGPSTLSLAERELIAAYTSGLNGCVYCLGTHRVAAEVLGAESGLVDKLLADIETAPVGDRLRPLFRYARTLTLTPTKVTQADADAIFDAGWDEDAFHSVISICALFNYYNRILDGHGIQGTPDYHVEAGERLAKGGYAALLDRLGIAR